MQTSSLLLNWALLICAQAEGKPTNPVTALIPFRYPCPEFDEVHPQRSPNSGPSHSSSPHRRSSGLSLSAATRHLSSSHRPLTMELLMWKVAWAASEISDHSRLLHTQWKGSHSLVLISCLTSCKHCLGKLLQRTDWVTYPTVLEAESLI